jgi:uncharacterized protein (DUF305 family)
MKKIVVPVLLSVLVATSLSGCSVDLGALLTAGGQTTAQQPGAGGSAAEQEFDAQDIMFAQMMIVHHRQAVELSELALANTTTPEILDLANRILATQQPEIDTMVAWLDKAGAPTEGHVTDMDGMVDEETMARLESFTGPAFDALFLTSMISHHEGAIQMAGDISSVTTNDEVLAFADGIRETQNAEIDEMTLLLGP